MRTSNILLYPNFISGITETWTIDWIRVFQGAVCLVLADEFGMMVSHQIYKRYGVDDVYIGINHRRDLWQDKLEEYTSNNPMLYRR